MYRRDPTSDEDEYCYANGMTKLIALIDDRCREQEERARGAGPSTVQISSDDEESEEEEEEEDDEESVYIY